MLDKSYQEVAREFKGLPKIQSLGSACRKVLAEVQAAIYRGSVSLDRPDLKEQQEAIVLKAHFSNLVSIPRHRQVYAIATDDPDVLARALACLVEG